MRKKVKKKPLSRLESARLLGWYTVAEAAEAIGRSESTVLRYCREAISDPDNAVLEVKSLGYSKPWIISVASCDRFKPPLRGNPDFRKKSFRKKKAAKHATSVA